MPLINRTIGFFAQRILARFEADCRNAEQSQRQVLANLTRQGADTTWGKSVGLADIRTPEVFAQRIPLTNYEDAAPWWHRAFDGHRDVTWPGHTKYFALSSGTTAGNKLLPVTADAIKSNLRAGTLLTAMMLRRGAPGNANLPIRRLPSAAQLLSGRFLYLGGSTTLRQRGPCLCGDASGIMGTRIPFYVRRRRLPQPDIAALTDWDQKISAIVHRHLTADVRLMAACPSWAALLFKELLHEASAKKLPQKSIGELWPRFSYFVSYGMAFEPYRTAFQQYIGRAIHFVDTWSSSEGGMNGIQEEDGGPLRLIPNNGTFFEFIPAPPPDRAAETGGGNPPRLHLGQVQTGVDYAVVLTTNGGIWAYSLGDVIRFESLSPPRFRFVGRTQIMLSAFGEHVTLEMIETAIATACKLTHAIVADYTIEPLYPSPERPKPGHRWLIEFDRPPAGDAGTGVLGEAQGGGAAFMQIIDRSIRAGNEDYDTHRTHDFGMTPPELLPLAPRTFYTWMKSRGKLGAQNKVPRVIKSPDAAALQQISRAIEHNSQP